MVDVTILTMKPYVSPKRITTYISNVLQEDHLLIEALEKQGLKVDRTNWDNPTYDWSKSKTILFRGIWDYFDRFDEFQPWLERVSKITHCINPIELIWWNIDKHYLSDLQEKGIRIVPTIFIDRGEKATLQELINNSGWETIVLKPAISGTARHTYKIDPKDVPAHESIFQELIAQEDLLLQPFLSSIKTRGEVSHMVFDGKYSHSVLKTAKAGDFRVQDDFGGTVHDYSASAEEIQFAENAMKSCAITPIYGRVDVVWDLNDQLAVAELEIVEPELWFRRCPQAARDLAAIVSRYVNKLHNL